MIPTCESVMALVTLILVEDANHDIEYDVHRKVDGAILGRVHRRIYQPNTNYRGTRIRRVFKGSPKWFAELPFAMRMGGPRLWRIDNDTRWEAINMLVRHRVRLDAEILDEAETGGASLRDRE